MIFFCLKIFSMFFIIFKTDNVSQILQGVKLTQQTLNMGKCKETLLQSSTLSPRWTLVVLHILSRCTCMYRLGKYKPLTLVIFSFRIAVLIVLTVNIFFKRSYLLFFFEIRLTVFNFTQLYELRRKFSIITGGRYPFTHQVYQVIIVLCTYLFYNKFCKQNKIIKEVLLIKY